MTEKRPSVTENSGSVTNTKRDSLARAQETLRVVSRCHAVTNPDRDVTLQRDSDKPGPEAGPVTITQSTIEACRQKDRARLMTDPRFASWVAAQ